MGLGNRGRGCAAHVLSGHGTGLFELRGNFGAGDRIRTGDIDLGKVALYQLSYSRAVANSPSRSFYNPLFIYGGVGMGKTHDARHWRRVAGAICFHARGLHLERALHERDDDSQIRPHAGISPPLPLSRRAADQQNIQILAGKERTQEEFFPPSTAEHQKQIVISSDSAEKHARPGGAFALPLRKMGLDG